MQAAVIRASRTAGAKSNKIILVNKRYASSPTSSQPDVTKSSNALPVAGAAAVIIGGLAYYVNAKTGSPDRVAKAMVKTGTPAQNSGGLGKMDADHTITTGERSS